jgi:DNA-damage-inducible protein J
MICVRFDIQKRGSMSKSAQINARIDPNLKQETEKIFHELGLSTTQAITLFFKQVTLQQGLPFAVAIPNAETRKAINDARTGKKPAQGREC